MAKYPYLVWLVVCFSTRFLSAQEASTSPYGPMANGANAADEINQLADSKHYRAVAGFDNRYQGIKGSPFWAEEWTPGVLYLKDSSLIRKAFVYKFDTYSNEIWAKDSTGFVRVLHSAQLQGLDLKQPGGSTCLLRKSDIPALAGGPDRLYQQLYSGKQYVLVADIRKILKKSNLEDRGLVTVGNAFDWFEAQYTYWLKIGNQPFVEVSLKKNKFTDALGAKAETYCKQQKYKAKLTPEEAAQVLHFLEH